MVNTRSCSIIPSCPQADFKIGTAAQSPCLLKAVNRPDGQAVIRDILLRTDRQDMENFNSEFHGMIYNAALPTGG